MSWSDFENRRQKAHDEEQKNVRPEPIDDILASVFQGQNGLKALIWLRERTKERVLPAGAPESALRELEGQRHLVHEIELRISRGRKEDDRDSRRTNGEHTRPSAKRAKGSYARRLTRAILGR